MDTASEDQRQDWGDPAEDAPEEPTVGRRRLLLGVAAGGFALAASGLVLPEWLMEEAEAANHPVRRIQGRKERRREKRRDAHGQHRDKKDKRKDHDKPRGGNPFDRNFPLAIAVHNNRPTAVRVRGWQITCASVEYDRSFCSTWEMPTVWDWQELPGRTGDQHGQTQFVSARSHIAVQIGDNHVLEWLVKIIIGIDHDVPLLEAAIWTGGWGAFGNVGGRSLKSEGMRKWKSISADGIKATLVGVAESGHALLSVDLE